jgi:hypothetical protein
MRRRRVAARRYYASMDFDAADCQAGLDSVLVVLDVLALFFDTSGESSLPGSALDQREQLRLPVGHRAVERVRPQKLWVDQM